jgi:hypothetical protein
VAFKEAHVRGAGIGVLVAVLAGAAFGFFAGDSLGFLGTYIAPLLIAAVAYVIFCPTKEVLKLDEEK